jgi:hypothetical protein
MVKGRRWEDIVVTKEGNMENQAIEWDATGSLPFFGGIAGIVAGFAAAVIAFYMEAAVIAAIVLAPLFGVVGVACGVTAKRHGWSIVGPAAAAIIGGVIFHIDKPTGWIIGGVLGGAISGVLTRSIGKSVRGVLIGSVFGLVGWAVVWCYLLGCVLALRWLDGN